MTSVLRIHATDNVAVALELIKAGTELEISGLRVTALEEIPAGHKIALEDIPEGKNIIKYGYEQAVTMTTDKMLRDVQTAIRSDFITFLGSEGTTPATGVGLQAALAETWGKLQILFEDDGVSTVHFMNPMDIADYLKTAQITTQTAFGMTYVENFLGMGTVILTGLVTKGKIYSTAKENIVLYYVPVNGADLGEAFDFTSDSTGLIGIHETSDYSNLTASDTVLNGMTLFADRLDGIVATTITAATASEGQEGEH